MDYNGFVLKKDGSEESFDEDKISQAIGKAMLSVNLYDDDNIILATKLVKRKICEEDPQHKEITVEQIHSFVEQTLMDCRFYEIAKEYISYRNRNKPDIFRKRTNIKPYEYPQLIEFINGIRNSYWLHTSFNYTSDKQDMLVKMLKVDQIIANRAMLAISQIESAVKAFWGRIDMHLPKPEISKVGATFAESEVRHEDAYSTLIEELGLNQQFKELEDVPAIQKRIKYLNRINENSNSSDPKEFFEAIILFSMMVENVSLFSQFLIIMSYNRKDNKLKGMSNAIEATSLEENLHAAFGAELVQIIRDENPDWWTEDLEQEIITVAEEAYAGEMAILGWIYGEGDSEIAPKAVSEDFIRHRINKSLQMINIEPQYVVNDPSQFEWFEDELILEKNGDFFNKHLVDYDKHTRSYSEEDLWD